MTQSPLNLVFDKLSRLIFLKSYTGRPWFSSEERRSYFIELLPNTIIQLGRVSQKKYHTSIFVFKPHHKNYY